jgi:phosphate transport system protein
MNDEMRKSFHQELDEIRDEVLRLGGMLVDRISRATGALLAGDLGAAQNLVAGDDDLDVVALDIEERCYSVLARQNPVASDLRAVITAIWTAWELERSGDLATNIAKATRRIFGYELNETARAQVAQMGAEARRLCGLAVDAYGKADGSLGLALKDIDDRLDGIHADYIQAIFAEHEGADDIQPLVQMALIGRFFERIGDHAVNIGERVHYMATGVLPEHTARARQDLVGRESGPATPPGQPT